MGLDDLTSILGAEGVAGLTSRWGSPTPLSDEQAHTLVKAFTAAAVGVRADSVEGDVDREHAPI